MDAYELRILRHDGHEAIVMVDSYPNDDAAVLSAKTFAGDREFEVWRGMTCVYGIAIAAYVAKA